jgi:hypothetical protein
MNKSQTHYKIVTLREDGAWVDDEVGGPNEFDTEAEAWTAVEALRPILTDEDGEQAKYDVRPIEEA